MNNSVCPSGHLPLGYSVDYFPYVYEQLDGRFNGVFLDLFSTIATQCGCKDGVTLRKFLAQRMSSEFEVFDGAVDRGEVLTAIDTSWLRVSDVKRYRYSATAIRTKMMFMERQMNDVFTSDLSFFVVFPEEIFAIIMVAWVIYGSLDYFHSRLSRSTGNKIKKTPLELLDFLRRLLYQFFSLFVYLMYQSSFNGNNLIATTASTTPFFSAVNQLRNGQRKLVLTTGDQYFKGNETETFLGSNSSIIWGGEYVEEVFRVVCEDPTRIGLFYEPDLYSFYSETELTSKCRLAEIVLPAGESSGLQWLTHSIHYGDSYHFLISRNFSQKVMDAISFTLLTIYSPDHTSMLISRNVEWKYFLAAAKYEQNQAALSLAKYRRISFEQVKIPLIFLGVGLFISCVAFIGEQVAARTKLKRTKGSLSIRV